MLLPAYTAREPMIKSTIPQTATNGMNTSISRRLYSQVLLANSEIASRMWKPPSTNIIIAAYVSQPGRLIVVGVLSLSFVPPFLPFSRACCASWMSVSRRRERRRHRLHRSRLPALFGLRSLLLLAASTLLGTSTRVKLACSSHHIGIQAEQVVTLHSALPLSEVNPQLR